MTLRNVPQQPGTFHEERRFPYLRKVPDYGRSIITFPLEKWLNFM